MSVLLIEKVDRKFFFKKRTSSGFHTCILIISEYIYLRTILSKILVDFNIYIFQKVSGATPEGVKPQESNPKPSDMQYIYIHI